MAAHLPGATVNHAPQTTGRWALAAALVGSGVALGFGAAVLHAWIGSGRFPMAGAWSDPLPLVALVGLVCVLAAAAVRRAGSVAVFAGVLAWSLGVHGAADLPPFAANAWSADGPHGALWLLAIATGLGVFAAAGPRRWRPDERLAAVLVVAITGSANLFSRSGEGVFGLLAAGVLVHLAAAPRHTARLPNWTRWIAGAAALFAIWTWIAVANGADTALGYRVGLRVVTGALLALGLARGLDRRGAGLVLGALVAGGALALGAVAIDLAAALRTEPLDRVLGSRLRGLGMHPNGVGPLFASTAIFALAAAVRARGIHRLGGVLVVLAALAALERTQSRASVLGFAAGLAVFLAAFRWGAPRRARGVVVGGVALLAAFAVALASPLGTRAQVALDALAGTPSALGQRWHLWRASLTALSERPWTGLGPNQSFLRAQYAEPSFYDGTPQDLHPHQLLLAIAEGAGWPALVFFVALLIGAGELARRALAPGSEYTDRSARARALPAGLFAGGAAILVANQLDLGLSQNTFAPLWTWVLLGALAALQRPNTPEGPALEPARWGRGALALALFVPLVLQPLCVAALAASADAALVAGEPAAADRAARRVEMLSPGDARAYLVRVRTARALGSPGEVLALRQARAAAAPGRASTWHALAADALERRQFELARTAVQHARRADPRGERSGDVAYIEAALAFLAGDLDVGRAKVREAMLAGSPAINSVPHVALPRESGDAPGVTRRAFAVAGGESVRITDVLADLGTEAVALARTDPVTARRLLHPVVFAYAQMGLVDEAVAWIERHRDAGESRQLAIAAVEVELLARAGRWDEARERVDAGGRAPHLRIALARAELLQPDPAELERSRAQLPSDLARIGETDLFFTAGVCAPTVEVALRLALADGRHRDALGLLARLLHDTPDVPTRQQRAGDVLSAALASPDSSLDVRARALAAFAAQWRLGPRLGGRGSGARRELAAPLASRARGFLGAGSEPAWDKVAAARAHLAWRGSAEAALLAEIERLARTGE